MPTDVDLTNRIEEAGATLKVTIPKQDSGMWTYLFITVFAPMLIFFLLGWWLNRPHEEGHGGQPLDGLLGRRIRRPGRRQLGQVRRAHRRLQGRGRDL